MHIWVQALPTGEPVRLTQDEANEDYPAFSPDGTKIAFRSDRDGGGIYVVPLLGGEPRLLAPQGDSAPILARWAARFCFIPAITEGHGARYVRWPAARQGWEAHPHVFLIPADGGERRQVQSRVRWLDIPCPSCRPMRVSCSIWYRRSEVDEISMAWYIVPVAGGPAVRAGTPEHIGHFIATTANLLFP